MAEDDDKQGPWAKYSPAPTATAEEHGPWETAGSGKTTSPPTHSNPDLDDYLKTGGTPASEQERQGVTPLPGQVPMKPQTVTQFEKERTPQGSSTWRGLKAFGSDVGGAISSIGDAVTGGPLGAMASAPKQAAALVLADQNRKEAGYSPLYRGAAALGGIAGVNAEGMEESAAHGDTAGVVGHTALPVISAAAGADQALTGGKGMRALGDIAGKATAPNLRQSLAEKAVGGLVRKPPLATMQDIKFGRDPARAIAKEGIVAPSKEALVQKIDGRIGELSNALDQQLQNHPNAGAHIDAEPIIDKHVDRAVQDARKVGNQGAVNRLEALRTALKTEYGSLQGNPYEMNNLKRAIGDAGSQLGAFKATDPLEASAASAMGDIYTDLKNEVNKATPEIKPINERIADLIGAKTGVARNIALKTNVSPFSVIGSQHMLAKMAEGTFGSAPVRTGLARALNVGNVADVPQVRPTSFPQPIGPRMPSHAQPIGPQMPPGPFQLGAIGTPAARPGMWQQQVGAPPDLGWGGPTSPFREPIGPKFQEEQGLGHIQGTQQPLNLPPENAPLFNIQTPNPRGPVPEQPAPTGLGSISPIGGPGREGTLGRIGETKSVAPSPVESVKLPHPEVTDLKPGEATADRFYNKDTDEWSPEREANHEAVAEAAIKGKTAPTDRPPEAVITMGGTASGKTTLTRQILGADKNRVNIDSDLNKLTIPEYEGLKESDPENAAQRVHEESKAISRRIMQKAVADGLDLIYDTTTGGGGEKVLKQLKKMGYKVRVVYADVPVEEAVKRANERAESSEDPTNRGRIVPEDVIRDTHAKAAKAFNDLRNSPNVDEVQAFDTTTRNPEKFYSRQGQKETVHNTKVLDRIKEKANGQTTAAK